MRLFRWTLGAWLLLGAAPVQANVTTFPPPGAFYDVMGSFTAWNEDAAIWLPDVMAHPDFIGTTFIEPGSGQVARVSLFTADYNFIGGGTKATNADGSWWINQMYHGVVGSSIVFYNFHFVMNAEGTGGIVSWLGYTPGEWISEGNTTRPPGLLSVSGTFTVVTEPTSIASFGFGLAVLALATRRRPRLALLVRTPPLRT
ncbi:MAG: hypothetical protein WBC51_04955 [Vicinamibacterales bacterium]